MKLNLVVIRSSEIDRAVKFYQLIGLSFEKHKHGKGPMHYASEQDGFVFEIYPEGKSGNTVATRIGFRVDDFDGVLDRLTKIGASIIQNPTDSEWGRRAVIKDWDGHKVELSQAES